MASEEIIREFVAFCELSEEVMSRRAVVERTANASIRLTMTGDEHELVCEPGDIEDLRSLMADIRKLLLNDETGFLHIHNLVFQYDFDEQDRKNSALNRESWKDALGDGGLGFVVDGENYGPEKAFDLYAYAVVFHNNPEWVAKWKALDADFQGIAQVMVSQLMIRLAKIAAAQSNIVRDALASGSISPDP